jgi:hypothetical protein
MSGLSTWERNVTEMSDLYQDLSPSDTVEYERYRQRSQSVEDNMGSNDAAISYTDSLSLDPPGICGAFPD